MSWLRQRTRWPHSTSPVVVGPHSLLVLPPPLPGQDPANDGRAGRAVSGISPPRETARKQAAWGSWLRAPSVATISGDLPSLIPTLCLD